MQHVHKTENVQNKQFQFNNNVIQFQLDLHSETCQLTVR